MKRKKGFRSRRRLVYRVRFQAGTTRSIRLGNVTVRYRYHDRLHCSVMVRQWNLFSVNRCCPVMEWGLIQDASLHRAQSSSMQN